MNTANVLLNRLEHVLSTVVDAPENSLANDAGDPAFTEPLVGFARGDDPLFDDYRTHVGEHYGIDGYGCDLCQTGVPCESGIP